MKFQNILIERQSSSFIPLGERKIHSTLKNMIRPHFNGYISKLKTTRSPSSLLSLENTVAPG